MTNSFLFSALTICLLAVLAITAEAKFTKMTHNRGSAKMLTKYQKMKQAVALVGDDNQCCSQQHGCVTCDAPQIPCFDEPSLTYWCVDSVDDCQAEAKYTKMKQAVALVGDDMQCCSDLYGCVTCNAPQIPCFNIDSLTYDCVDSADDCQAP